MFSRLTRQKSLFITKNSIFGIKRTNLLPSNTNVFSSNYFVEGFRCYCQTCESSIPPGTPYEDYHLDTYLSNALEIMWTNDKHALEILDFVLAARPTQANALSKKAAILFGRMEFKEAVACLNKCLDSVPPEARVHILEDVICTYRGNYFEEPYAMHMIKGVYRRHLGQLENAISEFGLALLDRANDAYAISLRDELVEKRKLE